MQLQDKLCPFLSFSWVPQEQNLLSFDPFYIMHPKVEGIPTISDVSIDNSNIRKHFSPFGDPLWGKKSLPYLSRQRLWLNFGSPRLTGIPQAIIPHVQLSSSSCFLCLFFFPSLFHFPCCSTHITLSSLILLTQVVLEVQWYSNIRCLQMRQQFKILQCVSNGSLTSSDLLSIQTNPSTYSLSCLLLENLWLQITFITLKVEGKRSSKSASCQISHTVICDCMIFSFMNYVMKWGVLNLEIILALEGNVCFEWEFRMTVTNWKKML